jgi:hypothetical protein
MSVSVRRQLSQSKISHLNYKHWGMTDLLQQHKHHIKCIQIHFLQIYLCVGVGALGKSSYHGFKVEVNEDVCCFDIPMDDPRVACMRISIKKIKK